MKHKITASPPHKSFRAQNFTNKESLGIKIFVAGPENEMPRLVERAETKFGPTGSNLLAGETHGKVEILTELVSKSTKNFYFLSVTSSSFFSGSR